MWAGFDFVSHDVSSIEVATTTPDTFSYTFTATFDPECTSGCTGSQDYRLGFASRSIGSGSGRAPAISVGDLGNVMATSVTFTTTGDNEDSSKKQFSLGGWSSTISPFTNSTRVTATYTVTLKKTGLLNILNAGGDALVFYLVGEDVDSTRYYDSREVSIPLNRAKEVKISGLEDVVLNSADLSGNNLDADIAVCVYSSTSEVRLDFDGANVPGQDYQLSRTNECSQPGQCVPYRIRVKTPTKDWVTYRRKGQRQTKWTASTDVQCNGVDNMTIRVRLKNDDINDAGTGVYQDTMTVIVSPV